MQGKGKGKGGGGGSGLMFLFYQYIIFSLKTFFVETLFIPVLQCSIVLYVQARLLRLSIS